MTEVSKLSQLRAVPRFRNTEKKINRLGWGLSALVAFAFIGFNLAVVYAPGWLAEPLTPDTVVSRGIAIGVGIIVMAFVLTAYYIRAIGRRMDVLHDEFTGSGS